MNIITSKCLGQIGHVFYPFKRQLATTFRAELSELRKTPKGSLTFVSLYLFGEHS
jgi:hypothetical protein